MKIRNSFVSNSSSSSFIIKKSDCNDFQKECIEKFKEYIPKLDWKGTENEEFVNCVGNWDLDIGKKYYRIHTDMDNFYMEPFFDLIQVKYKHEG